MLNLQPVAMEERETRSWWALYTRHQHEKSVARILSAKDFEVYLPVYELTRHQKNRKEKVALPLFPSYVFVRGGLDRRSQAVSTPGVCMALSTGDRVAMIADDEIQSIRRATQSGHGAEPHTFLKTGERVRVRRGCLEGIEGVLIRKSNGCRLVVSIDMLSQSVGVEINAADVEPAGSPGAGDGYWPDGIPLARC